MADLKRLMRMKPFQGMSTSEVRAMVQAFGTSAEPSTSGASLGSYTSPTTRAVRGLPVSGGGGGVADVRFGDVNARYWDVIADEYWCLCDYIDGDPWDQAGPQIEDQVVFLWKGQPIALNSKVLMFKRNASDTYWYGIAVAEIYDFHNNEQWNEPNCAVEDCAPDVPPDLREVDWDDHATWPLPTDP